MKYVKAINFIMGLVLLGFLFRYVWLFKDLSDLKRTIGEDNVFSQALVPIFSAIDFLTISFILIFIVLIYLLWITNKMQETLNNVRHTE